MTVADKVCLVTGAARGLGASVVEQLRAAGATAVAADRRPGDGIRPMNVTEVEHWNEVVGEIIDRYGRIDVLVNNAGIIRVQPILEVSPEDFRKVIDTNLVGTFLGMQAVGRHMVAAGSGSIINVGSPASVEGTAGMPAYTSSKFGIRGLTKTAGDLKSRSRAGSASTGDRRGVDRLVLGHRGRDHQAQGEQKQQRRVRSCLCLHILER